MMTWLILPLLLASQDVQLRTADAQNIHAVTEKIDGAQRGVVLVHQEGRSAEDWRYLAGRLNKSGISTVAVDLRGHGTNPDKDLTEADYLAMSNDVDASVKWLRSQGVKEVSCVGASLGANLCIGAAARDPGIVNLVLLSPGLNVKGITVGESMKNYGDRPALFVAASDDPGSERAVDALLGVAKGQTHKELYPTGGKGARMFNSNAALEGAVQSWLLGSFKLASGEVVTPKPADNFDPGVVETTGTKLGSHK